MTVLPVPASWRLATDTDLSLHWSRCCFRNRDCKYTTQQQAALTWVTTGANGVK